MKQAAYRSMAFAIATALTFASPAQAQPESQPQAKPAPARAETAYLSQADAFARSARIANVDYVLDFQLSGKETFAGTTTVSFDLADTGSAVTLDLNKANVRSVSANGKPVAIRYNDWFITIEPAALVKGRNSVTVAYERQHSTNGEGLHRMVDPVDGRVYTYSHFEPVAAQQMFALFDQPDLKASYTVSVTAPKDWQVVTTVRETKIEEAGANRRWSFKPTRRLSPYNFSLHAGPYQVWEDNSGKYPMRLFARQSVAAQVVPADWFRQTKAGMGFFEDYFGIPYPFEKYDQLIVPDFLYGAMENAGAITFAEARYLGADMPADQKQSMTEVIMHEMAHQWFGNLVTMKWWNGLWLNESFASFMGVLATAESTEFTDSWQKFYLGGKQRAYAQDQTASTHPIEVPVPSSGNAFDNIDAITYSKGGAALKQLRHLLGEEVFRRGVHNYLVKYSWRNATLDDFISTLASTAGRDLKGWTDQWLYNAGVNTIAAKFSCSAGKISDFGLAQSAPGKDLPTLREQRVQVAAFKLEAGKLKLVRNVPVTYTGAHTAVPDMVGAACPDLVYPNYQDWGYAKVQMDQRSFATARTGLAKVDDPLLRAMLWQSLWDSVRDVQLPLDEFIGIALNNAPHETDYNLLGATLAKIGQSKHYIDAMGLDDAWARQTTLKLERMAWDGVLRHKGKPDFQRHWFTHYIGIASSPEALARLAGLLDGKTDAQGMQIGQDLRWSIIAHLNRYDVAGAQALIAAESARDKSDGGQIAAVAASAGRPDPAAKAEWVARIEDLKTTLPFSRIRTAMANVFPPEQGKLDERDADARLARLAAIDKAAGPVYMRSFAVTMIPATCSARSVQRLSRAASELKDLSTTTRRALLDTLREDQRCVAIKDALSVTRR